MQNSLGYPSASGSISSNSPQQVKGSSGAVYGWALGNTANAAAATFFNFFDSAAAPTIGTAIPVLSIEVGGGQIVNVPWPNGWAFVNGIWIAAATSRTGSTGPTSAVTFNILYL